MLVLIKGAGDLATGVAQRLHGAGCKIIMTDLPRPTAVRRTVSISRAIYEGEARVEDIRGVYAKSFSQAREILQSGDIPVLADETAQSAAYFQPDVLVDAIIAKRNTGTRITDADIVIALGPGFTAGRDCHAVIETMRGHDLGRVIYEGSAFPNTGVPGDIGGYGAARVLRAPCDGVFRAVRRIGDTVAEGDTVATVSGAPVRAEVPGVVRGLLRDGDEVIKGMKSGDVDPRGEPLHCFTISDKARSLGGAVLEAILHLGLVSGTIKL